VLGRGSGRQRAVQRPCGCRGVGGVAGALIEEPVDGVQGVARIKVGFQLLIINGGVRVRTGVRRLGRAGWG
jgi:hypothetical protein